MPSQPSLRRVADKARSQIDPVFQLIKLCTRLFGI